MRQVSEFKLKEPLPKYRATETLVKNLIEYILSGGFSVGSKFLSDNDIVTVTGRSRTAVRRALDILQKDGWISRQGGKGTYVGERLVQYHAEGPGGKDVSPEKSESSKAEKMTDDSLIRIAVAVSGLTDDRPAGHSWYHNDLLVGIDQAAAEENVVVEFLGYHGTRPKSLTKRLLQNRPDVFLCIGPPMNHVPLIGAAGRWRIPCVLAATRAPELGIPNFFEDSIGASRDAVRYLAGRGHRRIGYIQVMSPSGWWAFDRYEGYRQGMAEQGLEEIADNGLWMPLLPDEHSAERVRRYIGSHRLSAVICGSYWAAGHLAEWIRRDGVKIPDDLSCIVYDQNPVVGQFLGGIEPATIHLPLREMGLSFVRQVRSIVRRENVSPATAFPCKFTPGTSVADHDDKERDA